MSSKRAPPLPQAALDDLSDELLLRILCCLPPAQVHEWRKGGVGVELRELFAAHSSLTPGPALCTALSPHPCACCLPHPCSAPACHWCASGGGRCARGRARCGRSSSSTSDTSTTAPTCEPLRTRRQLHCLAASGRGCMCSTYRLQTHHHAGCMPPACQFCLSASS